MEQLTKEQAIAIASARARAAKATPAPAASTVAGELKKDIEGSGTKAIQSGIARSAMKTVRGLGTTLLPKSAEQWAEKKGFLPSEQDIALLGEAGKESGLAGGAELVGDVLTAVAPTVAAGRAVQGATKALPRWQQAAAHTGAQAGLGGAMEGALAEDDVAGAALRGAAWGAGGELVPRALIGAASRAVPSTADTKRLIQRGVIPTLGQGADPDTVRGMLVKTLEEATQVAPVSGMTVRAARDRASKQLLDKAAEAIEPAITTAGVTPRDVVQELDVLTKGAYREPLDKVKLPFRKMDLDNLRNQVDTVAKKHSLDPRTAAKISAELESMFSGVRGRTGPLSVLENMAESVASAGGSGAEKMVRNELAQVLRGTVDNASAAAGMPMAPVREARSAYHTLNKAVPQTGSHVEGLSGEKLANALRRNPMGSGTQTAVMLEQLAREGANIAPAAKPFGASNPARVLSLFGDVAAGTLSGGLAPGALLAYGGMHRTNLPKLLLGDKATRDAYIEALRNPAFRGVALGMDEE